MQRQRGTMAGWLGVLVGVVGGCAALSGGADAPAVERGGGSGEGFATGEFRWRASGPLVASAEDREDRRFSVKDPSVVFHEGRWHLFCTIRSRKRTHRIEYLSFTDWAKAGEGSRRVLTLHDGFFCAPQVFHYRPQARWYLVCQASDPAWTPLAAEKDKAFASLANVEWPAGRWSDSISHGEWLRAGVDERLEVESKDARLVFQGVSDAEREGKSYGEIPWRLGLLEAAGPGRK